MSTTNKLEHLERSINSRHSNQLCSIKLLALFSNHERTWKTKKFARAAQDLTAVAFSLWRAAFLAEKKGSRFEVFAHGRSFLERIIEDNSISYPQDKSSREWTFNYYTRNARASLQTLHEFWPEAVPEYQGKTRNSTERWEYCQSLLDEAVVGFGRLLAEREVKVDEAKSVKTARRKRKNQRAIVRKLTLAERNQS